ncbi:hypothetical protein RZS08_48550, partial [Arthrospira platensis SPKY1]|nr:hypothetical protein [Arthrospira platensis SPKY1]
VEGDRESGVGRDARAGRVEAELPDRDTHPARALVPEAEDPLAVRHDDDRRLGGVVVPEDLLDVVLLVDADVEAAPATEDVRELLARLADDRRVDDREHLVEV